MRKLLWEKRTRKREGRGGTKWTTGRKTSESEWSES